jgi:hypothetical protein
MDRIYSVGHFPNGVRHRLLMPLVGPLHEPFVGFVDKLGVASFALHQVIVPKPAPPRLQCTFELYPFAFELISVHGVFLLCELTMPRRGRSGSVLPPLGGQWSVAGGMVTGSDLMLESIHSG